MLLLCLKPEAINAKEINRQLILNCKFSIPSYNDWLRPVSDACLDYIIGPICKLSPTSSLFSSSDQRQTNMPIFISIGRYIGFTNNKKAYQYLLSVSADKEAHIGSPTDMNIAPFFSQSFIILAKVKCEKVHFFLVNRSIFNFQLYKL